MATARVPDNLSEEELRRRLAQNQQDYYELISQAKDKLPDEVLVTYQRSKDNLYANH